MFPTTENSTTDLATMLNQSAVTPTQEAGGKAFIRFEFETGEYSFGKEAVYITDHEVVVNTMTFGHGWTLWSNRKPTKKEVHFTQPLPPAMPSIGDDHPQESRTFDAAFTDEDNTILSFGTTSYGGKKGCDALLAAVSAKAATGEKDFLFPVVKLTSESYANAKRGGKLTYNPLFQVVRWLDKDGNEEGAKAEAIAAPVEEAAPVEAEEAPVKKKRRTAKA